jgi:uncharacterized protein
MTKQLQKPILIGGLALSAGLFGLNSLHQAFAPAGDTLILGTMAVGGGYWWWSKQRGQSKALPKSVVINSETLQHLTAQVHLIIDRLTSSGAKPAATSQLQQQLRHATSQLDRQSYQVAITGQTRVGKTTLLQELQTQTGEQPIELLETPALFNTTANIDDVLTQQLASKADVVIFVITADLTATEYNYLQTLSQQQRLLLVFNKQDQYLPVDRETIQQKIKQTVASLVSANNVVGTSAKPLPITVRKMQADGSVVESIERPPVDLNLLQQRLQQVLTAEGTQLILATTYRQINQIKTQGMLQLNGLRRQQALPIIEQNQWIVGATAFANPLAALDILAAAAINTQMIVDLGSIYQQKFSLEQAQALASNLGGLLLKLGLVELSTQAIGSILKTNAVTFMAGGLVQGLSAAYLTRIVGLTLVEYFASQDLVVPQKQQEQSNWQLDRFTTTLSQVFQANQRLTVLQDFVQQGKQRFIPTAEIV